MSTLLNLSLASSGAVVSCAILGARGLRIHAFVAVAVPLVWWFA